MPDTLTMIAFIIFYTILMVISSFVLFMGTFGVFSITVFMLFVVMWISPVLMKHLRRGDDPVPGTSGFHAPPWGESELHR